MSVRVTLWVAAACSAGAAIGCSHAVGDSSAVRPAAPQHAYKTEGSCPAGMAFIPPRIIEESRLSIEAIRRFKVECGGNPDPCHTPAGVEPPFCIDKTEVTAAHYARCVEAGTCKAASFACGPAANYGLADRAGHPMNCVTYPEAEAYCQAAGKRLVSFKQFIWAQSGAAYAAPKESAGQHQSGQALARPWGDRYPWPDEIWASIGDEPRTGTAPAGATPASTTSQGVQDLWGNVSEWTERASAGVSDGHAPATGPSFATTYETPITFGVYAPKPLDTRADSIGFRCATDPP